MAETKRMTKRDIDSALTYLRRVGIEPHADPDPKKARWDVTFPTGGSWAITESLSKRDIWMLARGHRIGSTPPKP